MQGQVKIETAEGRLRLRWQTGGERFCLSLGLKADKVNSKLAEGVARTIELDILAKNFHLCN